MERQVTILVADDEEKIREILKAYLEKSRYEVFEASDGEGALRIFEKETIDLLILDLMMPKINGEEVCKQIRQKSQVPILMLTAKVQEKNIINGLEIGADDYVTKPFRAGELMARVEALLRRAQSNQPKNKISSYNQEDLKLDINNYKVWKQGKEVAITPNEFRLLTTMQKQPNKVFTREELISTAFGFDYNGYERTIDSHIKNLRSKIETETNNPNYIRTIRGIGYQFGGVAD